MQLLLTQLCLAQCHNDSASGAIYSDQMLKGDCANMLKGTWTDGCKGGNSDLDYYLHIERQSCILRVGFFTCNGTSHPAKGCERTHECALPMKHACYAQ